MFYYSNRRYTQKITLGREKKLTLQKTVRVLKKIQNIRKTHQISRDLDELLKCYKIKYIEGRFGPPRYVRVNINKVIPISVCNAF